MKYFFALFFLVATAFLTGCCKIYCDDEQLGIDFSQLKAVDTDTVLFLTYKPGTGMQERIDSFYLRGAISPADTSRSSLFYLLDTDKDWKIILPAPLHKTYSFSEFGLETRKCNCGGNKYAVITTYRVNGQQEEGSHYFIR